MKTAFGGTRCGVLRKERGRKWRGKLKKNPQLPLPFVYVNIYRFYNDQQFTITHVV